MEFKDGDIKVRYKYNGRGDDILIAEVSDSFPLPNNYYEMILPELYRIGYCFVDSKGTYSVIYIRDVYERIKEVPSSILYKGVVRYLRNRRRDEILTDILSE